MKKKNFLMTIILLFIIVLTGCNVKIRDNLNPNEIIENAADKEIRDQSKWQSYVNSRFEYSIDFPSNWHKGEESQNNDGIILKLADSSFDIRVYGANYIEGVSKPYENLKKDGFVKKDITLKQGETAALMTGEEGSMSIYEMVLLQDTFEYHFYAKVSKEYAKEYEDVILNVIKSFNTSSKSEDKQPVQSGKEEEIIKDRSDKVMVAISEEDMSELAKYIHPEKGVRFTPYTYVSVRNDLVFKDKQIANFMKDTNKYLWGNYDGSGFEIKLTPKEYWNKFVYDQDFKNPDKISYNEVLRKSIAEENQFTVYENSIIVEYYFAGSKQYEGIDWESLRLVFQQYNNEWYLVGIIHNQHVI